MQMLLGMMIHTWLSMESHEHQPESVKGSDEDSGYRAEVGKAGARNRGKMHCFDDGVFRKKTGKTRDACTCQCRHKHRPVGNGHVFPESAHLAHILLVMH